MKLKYIPIQTNKNIRYTNKIKNVREDKTIH